jgi:hypothetical protein
MASAKAKDPLRRRAYMLGKLNSISAWRGKIVDEVISSAIIPCINRNSTITLKDAKRRARALFDKQLAFARSHPIEESGLRVSAEGDRFALFHAMEYGGRIPEEEIKTAWNEIETALGNLFVLGDMKDLLKGSDYIIAQRAIQFPLMDDVSVLAYPDLIAFRTGSPPVIVDWKVHAFGLNDAWLQLAIYAIALSRSNPHKDFPEGFSVGPTDSKLFEAQLLTNVVREHVLDEDHIIDAEEYIIESAYEMTCLTEGKKYKELDIDRFRPAAYPELCQRCAFRAICWEGQHVH